MASHLELAVGYLLGATRAVEPRLLSRPTPCARWDLRLLLRHTADSLDALCELLDGRGEAPDHVDPASAVRSSAWRLLGVAGAAAERPVPIGDQLLMSGIVVWTGALEIAAHAWDIGQTCGTRHPVPRALADDLLCVAPALISAEDRVSQFAEPVDVPRGLTSSDRLVAFLGRRPAA
jgi:uncharacterized protein (TIGR03086 family)